LIPNVSSVARRLFGMSAANLVGPLSAVVVSPLLARAFGPNGRGEYAALTTPLVLLAIAGTFGSQDGIAYFIRRGHVTPWNATKALFKWVLPASVTAGAAGVLIGLLLFRGHQSLLEQYVALLLLVLPFNIAFNMLAGVFTGAADTAGINGLRLIPTGIRTGLIILLVIVWPGISPFAAACVLLASPIPGLLWGVNRCRSKLRKNSAEADAPVRDRQLVRVSVAAFPGVLASISTARVDQMVGLPLIGAHQLGLYAVAVGVAELPMVVGIAGRVAVLGVRQTDGSIWEQYRISRLAVIIVASACGLLVLPTWILIPVVFGGSFRASVTPALILLGGTVIYTLGSCLSAILLTQGHVGAQSRALMGGALVSVGSLIALRSLGASGAALASVAGYLATAVLCWWRLRRLPHPRWRSVAYSGGALR
jgi:O-antigen/teichoic acid export membrane protein